MTISFARQFRWISDHVDRSVLMLGLAAVLGVGAGVGSVAFSTLLDWCHDVFFGTASYLDSLSDSPRISMILVPAVGGLLAGLLIFRFAREAKGHGVPEVMEAVATRRGNIRKRVVVVKSVASSLTLGSGGSAGQEGPIVQIGAALGSAFGQLFGMSADLTKVLVGCGAAGGIAAIFHTPIAGVLFALEIILGDWRVQTFSPVVITSVIASVVSQNLRAVFGLSESVLEVSETFALHLPWELGNYLILGVVCGALAVGFIRTLYWAEDAFDGWRRLPGAAKVGVGGLLTGLIGLADPSVLGSGYPAINEAINGGVLVQGLLLLLVLKMFATSSTLGSGGSGGVFAPSLVLGAAAGGLVGHAMAWLIPGMDMAPPGAYALVGMGGMVAGTTHASLTAMLMIFEMTGSYSVILALMLTVTIATLVARAFEPESVYTMKLARRGGQVGRGIDYALLSRLHVGDAMFTNYVRVAPDTPVSEVVRTAKRARSYDFPVADSDDRLLGMIGLPDIAQAMEAGVPELLVASDLTSTSYTPLYPQQSLADALRQFEKTDRPTLPVVQEQGISQIIGMLDARQIMNLYERVALLGGIEALGPDGQLKQFP